MLERRTNGATPNAKPCSSQPPNGAAQPDLAKLSARMTTRRYEEGRILYMPGDRCKTLFLLDEGRVHLYHLSLDGRKFVVNVLQPGDVFGAVTLSPNYHHRVFAETVDECAIRTLNVSYARELVLREPQAALLIINHLGQQLTHVEDKLETMVFEPLAVRLARYMVECAEDNVVNNHTHQELGEIVGAYRESITVTLNRFKAEGLIEMDRRCIKIVDATRLTTLARGKSDSGSASPNGRR